MSDLEVDGRLYRRTLWQRTIRRLPKFVATLTHGDVTTYGEHDDATAALSIAAFNLGTELDPGAIVELTEYPFDENGRETYTT